MAEIPDDLGINKFLKEQYGTTIDGKPLFRLLWTTKVTEHRHSKFNDFYGELLIRSVTETREVLKYPYAQDRWVLERIQLLDKGAFSIGGLRTDLPYSYEEVYLFQDRNMNALPLSLEITETAIMLFFKFYLALTPTQRADMRMQMLAQRDKEKRDKTRDILGEGRSAFGFVLSSIKR
jgi:hypothetical protein